MQTKQQFDINEMKASLILAKAKLLEDNGNRFSCVVLKKGEYITSDAIGIKPLMVLLRVDKSCFNSAVVADKIIGKAAALMLVLGGALAVYGHIMSQSAQKILSENNIYFEYGSIVENIKNRDKTDICPMEKSVFDITDPTVAFYALEETIAKLMANKN